METNSNEVKETKVFSLEEITKLLIELREFFNNPDMTILGSTALKLCGLNVDIHDIDILIEYQELGTNHQQLLDKLLLLEKMTASKDVFHSDSTDKSEGRYCYLYKGVKVDIWIRKKDLLDSCKECFQSREFEINSHLWYNYMKVQKVLDVLKYKKQYARSKDFKVIEDIASQILKRDDTK